MVLLGRAIADAADQVAAEVDGKGHALFALLQALDPVDGHFLAIGMRDGSGHARNLIVAGKLGDGASVAGRRCAEQQSLRAYGHGDKIRGRGP